MPSDKEQTSEWEAYSVETELLCKVDSSLDNRAESKCDGDSPVLEIFLRFTEILYPGMKELQN